MHTGLVPGDGHCHVGGYSAHDVTDDPVHLLVIVMDHPVPLLASAAGVVVLLTRSMMMMMIVTMMMVTVTMMVFLLSMMVVMIMVMVMVMLMLVVMVAVQVPGEGLLAGPGCLGELPVLGHDGHQPLEAEAGEAQQEARALALGHALAHVGVAGEYSCTWRLLATLSLLSSIEAMRFRNKARDKKGWTSTI